MRPNYKYVAPDYSKMGNTEPVFIDAETMGEAEAKAPRGLMVHTKLEGARGEETCCYYYYPRTREARGDWDGTFGRYRDDRFCGLNCGYRWAISIAERLEEENRMLVTYDQTNIAKEYP